MTHSTKVLRHFMEYIIKAYITIAEIAFASNIYSILKLKVNYIKFCLRNEDSYHLYSLDYLLNDVQHSMQLLQQCSPLLL